MKFRTHAKLMSFLLLAEKEQQILLKNAEVRPAHDTSTVETHATETGIKQKPRTRIQRHQARRQVPPRDKSKPFAPFQSQFHSQSRQSPTYQHRSQAPKAQSSDARHKTAESSLTCHRCGRLGHIVKHCRSSQYLVNLYKELQDLKSKSTPREAHSLDLSREAHSVDFSDLDPDLENYLVSTSKLAPDSLDIALLDSATTHSILRHPDYFQFEHTDSPWQTCELTTIAGKRNLKFKEGWAKLLLPGGTSLTLARAMYAPAAPRNLISYKDLRAQDVHLTTEGVKGEEAIELRRRGATLATATTGATGLYSIKICPPTGRAQSRQRSAFAVTDFEPRRATDGDDRAPGLRRDHVPARPLSDQDPVAGAKLKRSSAVIKANLRRKAQTVLSDAPPKRQRPHSGPAVVTWGTNAHAMDGVFVGNTPTKSGLWHGRPLQLRSSNVLWYCA